MAHSLGPYLPKNRADLNAWTEVPSTPDQYSFPVNESLTSNGKNTTNNKDNEKEENLEKHYCSCWLTLVRNSTFDLSPLEFVLRLLVALERGSIEIC